MQKVVKFKSYTVDHTLQPVAYQINKFLEQHTNYIVSSINYSCDMKERDNEVALVVFEIGPDTERNHY